MVEREQGQTRGAVPSALSRERALAEISDVLTFSSLDYRETQHRVARLSVNLLGVMCGVLEVRPDGRLGRVVVLGADPARQAIADRMLAALNGKPGSLVRRAVETRAPVLLRLDELPAALGQVDPHDARFIQLHAEMGARSLLAVPMMSRDQLVGVLAIASPQVYDDSDVDLAREVARRAAVTIDNARLYEESRLQAAVAANLAEGITLFRLDDGTVAFANSRAEEMFGYEPGEMIGKHISVLSPLADTDRNVLLTRVLREAERTGSWHGELQNRRKDGSCFWVSVSASVYDHPEMGKVLLAARTDISARKALEEQSARALREKEVLLKEIHHRVKNNLQVISSLFYLQKRRATDEQVRSLLDESRGRIESIALIHEQLYQASSLADIDFDEYLNRLLAAILSTFDATNVRARSSAPGVVLDVEQAVPCALVASELLCNSLKHAFRGRPGELWVTARLEEGRTVVMEVGDDGVGFPPGLDWRAAQGLGLQLVQGLAKQLRGAVELDTSPRGTRFTLRFPHAASRPADPGRL